MSSQLELLGGGRVDSSLDTGAIDLDALLRSLDQSPGGAGDAFQPFNPFAPAPQPQPPQEKKPGDGEDEDDGVLD